ncbi:COX1/OXI3 intron 2 protein [Actinidia chinensis var. chinensis]|uniref:COX1/OXI3 intron 2 protein n=1 Tax=Actinidia chinensis var. chinensis TaxID=1590841 RepID=A0A2R6Q4G4_ACTCC|nr:COX1/OXI3 intron 2 protein [Actinidia chinensis var. chinensis]
MLFRLRRATALRITASILFPSRLHSTLSLSSISPPPIPIEPLTKPQLKTLVLAQYHHGKFSHLLENVVASPSVLLTACHNLIPLRKNNGTDPNSSESLSLNWVSNNFFSLEEIEAQIVSNRFNIESCCVAVPESSKGGESLVLPNLKLKVVIEAIRMVLEVLYDDRFVTFSYGGRVGMGRHTAIRYLKNSVENPSWWFTVSFDCHKFDVNHVKKLCLIMEEKIGDGALIDLIKRLFESEAVRIELGGCYLGRGFPQESGLSSILINIYFNAFDKEIQELRLQINRENPKFKLNENGTMSSNVFYKPLKIYAVRYLDEILVITSGSKMLTMDLKNRVVNFLDKNFDLRVDRVKTAIHSATSEKIDFLGMELRAVLPSVLRPPMSQKAIRARKKYLRQKEVKALELRNARETNRKKLGLKIMEHIFKKSKRSNGFKFDFHIENEVRQIFRTWADEVVQDFLGSLEERWSWHRMLSAGDFLSLRRIREQLPQELVEAYDNFQEQVDKYLNPVKARKALEEEQRRVEEEEERRYAERTVDDLTKLCMKVDAPEELVRKAVRMAGFTNHMGRPRPIGLLMALEDSDIIKWYAGVGRRWLDFFCCCHNFKMVKTVVTYHLRFSCILTLAEKHESTKREAIRHYTKDLKVLDVNGIEEMYFPTEREIKMMGDNNLSDPKPVDGALTMALIRLASDEPSYRCVVHFCSRTDTVVYRIRLLQKDLNINPVGEKKWVVGMGTIHGSLNRKCLPLCCDHISALHMGKLTLQDIDSTLFVDVD